MEIHKRFSNLKILTPETQLFGGATAKQWDEALTGNMSVTLAELKVLAQSGKAIGTSTVRLDLASAVKRFQR